MRANVYLSELLDAFEWVSAAEPLEGAAYVSRQTGQIFRAPPPFSKYAAARPEPGSGPGHLDHPTPRVQRYAAWTMKPIALRPAEGRA